VAESGDPRKVKVIDRRWFTAEGELREGATVVATPPPPPAHAAEPATTVADAEPAQAAGAADAPRAPDRPREMAAAPPGPVDAAAEPRGAEGALPAGPSLADIVDLLAQQAMAFLSGQVPGRGRDPATARYFIDLLGVLKEKTAGRLTLEETNFLDDVLYQLRSLYVAATR